MRTFKITTWRLNLATNYMEFMKTEFEIYPRFAGLTRTISNHNYWCFEAMLN